jgi:hypothetical protein
MGKKEKRKKLVQKQAVEKLSKSDNLKRMLSAEIMRLRTDAASHRSKLNETLVSMAKEIAGIRTDVSVMKRAIIDEGILTVPQLQKAYDKLQNQTLSLFDDKGDMKGSPIVTCYNTDFKIESKTASVDYVYTLSNSEEAGKND